MGRVRETLREKGWRGQLRAAGWHGPGGFSARLTPRNVIEPGEGAGAICEAGGRRWVEALWQRAAGLHHAEAHG